jgi:hypothetical protein
VRNQPIPNAARKMAAKSKRKAEMKTQAGDNPSIEKTAEMKSFVTQGVIHDPHNFGFI